MPTFYEFFAGGGMARAGLGSGWSCVFANDCDQKKADSYALNWGAETLLVRDVAAVKSSDLPGHADLAWASFPCQDLSLAGAGAGLRGSRSGTFWPFWQKIQELVAEGRGPRLIVLENVIGTLTSHGGKDFSAICKALARTSYRFGAIVVDAEKFVPQSRPRLFVIGTLSSHVPRSIQQLSPTAPWHNTALIQAFDGLPQFVKDSWIWWKLPIPPARNVYFSDLIEESPTGIFWHTREQTASLLRMMSELNLEKVAKAKALGRRVVGGVYKRTRLDKAGNKVQRAEVRFDDVAGCLRTPAGGSSRQLILVVDGRSIRSRLLSAREAARLMGLHDAYELPKNYNDGYHLVGDGVVVPVVRFIAAEILERIPCGTRDKIKRAA